MKHQTPQAAPFELTEPDLIALIELIGRDSFAEDLADLLSQRLGFDHFHIFLYRDTLAPALLASRPSPVSYATGLENYLNYTYVINPAYRAYRMGREAGVYMIADLVPRDSAPVLGQHDVEIHIEDSEPIGYRTPGWPRNMAEVIVLVGLPNKTMLDLSFLTPLGSHQTTTCKAALTRIFPLLNAVLQRQFAANPGSLDVQNRTSGQEDRFHDFGAEVLTAREREIVQLILIGHSSNSISLHLGISLPTVKTHRRNIYSKFQISSQAELFSLFLLYLK